MTIAGLTEVGQVIYNNYTFDGAFHASVQVEYILDEAQRVRMFTKYTILVEAVIADGSLGSNIEMATIHRQLSEPGKQLIFSNKGFGSPVIIGTGGFRDVRFGPIPKILTWDPIGSNKACYVRWQVETYVNDCFRLGSDTGVLALNYDVEVNIDNNGYTTRRIAGFIQIANWRVGQFIANNPDLYRQYIGGSVPLGFKRQQTYTIDKSRCRLNFSVTDTEIPSNNPFPPLVTDIKGTHNARWSRREAYKQRNTMAFQIHPRADTSPVFSYFTALVIMRQRIDWARKVRQKECLLDDVSITEDLFGRAVQCEFSWTTFGPLQDILTDNAVWFPIINDNPQAQPLSWDLWRTSMSNMAHHPYGNAKWMFTPQDDIIVDLCNRETVRPGVNDQSTNYRPGFPAIIQGFANDCPVDEKNSYISYDMTSHLKWTRRTVSQEILQEPDVVTGLTDMTFSQPPTFGNPEDQKVKPNVVQQSTAATYYIVLFGQAKRLCYKIPKPLLVSVGGRAVTEIGGDFLLFHAKNAAGVVVYSAIWRLVYALAGAPGALEAHGSPLEGTLPTSGGTAPTEPTSEVRAKRPDGT